MELIPGNWRIEIYANLRDIEWDYEESLPEQARDANDVATAVLSGLATAKYGENDGTARYALTLMLFPE